MKVLDRVVVKQIFQVYREQPSGAWTEIYRTPDKEKATAEAEKMSSWDARTKVVSRVIHVIEDLPNGNDQD